MNTISRNALRLCRWGMLLGALATLACQDQATAPTESAASLAKGGAAPTGKSSVTVSAAEPDTIPIDTVLTVRILGSGFAPGASVEYLLGTTVSTTVTAAQVVFVSATELRTTTVVGRNAVLGSYSIAVTSGGKRGIGVEKIEVVARPVELATPIGSERAAALDVNDAGVIVGKMSDAGSQQFALRWTPQGASWIAEILGAGQAVAINAAGDILRVAVRVLGTREVEADTWVRLAGGGEVYLGPGSATVGISDDGTVVGSVLTQGPSGTTGRPAAWMRTGPGSWTGPILLPSLPGYSPGVITSISPSGEWVAGSIGNATVGEWSVIWKREGEGFSGPFLVDPVDAGYAQDVNDRGESIGQLLTPVCSFGYCYSDAVFWPAIGVPPVILSPSGLVDTQSGLRYSFPYAMNAAAQIVGTARLRTSGKGRALPGGPVPVLWPTPYSLPVALGMPKARERGTPYAMNGRGLAVGEVHEANNSVTHAIAWLLP